MSNGIRERYGWSSASPMQSASYLLPALYKALTRIKPKHILDVGCGNGSMTEMIHNLGFSIAGMEPDPDGYQIARNRNESIKLYNDSIYDSFSGDTSDFDCIISTEVIEHLYKPEALLSFANSVLPEDGYIVLSTPYHGYLKNLLISLAGKWDDHHTSLWTGGHIKFWSRNSIYTLLRNSGFTPISFMGVGRCTYLWKSMIIVAQKTRLR